MKNLNVFLIYILEILIVISLMHCIQAAMHNQNLFSWINNILLYRWLEVSAVFLVVYQLLVFSILTLKDSTEKDSLLARIKVFKLAELRIEFNRDFDELKSVHDLYIQSKHMHIDKRDKEDIKELYEMYNLWKAKDLEASEYLFYLKNKLISLQHEFDYLEIGWRISFLLRLIK